MRERKLGLYLHIPFCVRKCAYCDFLSGPADGQVREAYVEALCGQIRDCGAQLSASAQKGGYRWLADTVFFGGGTPSLLKPQQIGRILDTVRCSFDVDPEAEITMECNPGTAGKETLAAFRQTGVNRLSIGLQSADDRELKLLGRIHSMEDFMEVFCCAREAGFSNINVDLISALPGQSVESLAATLAEVLALEPEHLSVYSLIIEEGTPFYAKYHDGEGLPGEEVTAAMDELVWKVMERAGYEHYEISNYAKPGFACRHNLKYWSCEEYLGCGVGAASYMKRDCGLYDGKDGYVRSRCITDTAEYIRLCSALPAVSADTPGKETLCAETEALRTAGEAVCPESERSAARKALLAETDCLSLQEEIEEYAFLGLRRGEGISVSEFEARFKRSFAGLYGSIADRYLDLGLMRWEYDRIFLTQEGMEVSNRIMADFLLDGLPEETGV